MTLLCNGLAPCSYNKLGEGNISGFRYLITVQSAATGQVVVFLCVFSLTTYHIKEVMDLLKAPILFFGLLNLALVSQKSNS